MRLAYGMGIFLLAFPGWARVPSADPARTARVRLESVRVEEVVLPSGAVLEAWYRPPRREGYTWIEGRFDEAGRYLPGYWAPQETEVRYGGEMVWVPGHREAEEWVPGYWRAPERPGFTWEAGYYDDDGEWHAEYWRRISSYPPEEDPHPPFHTPHPREPRSLPRVFSHPL